MKLLKKDLELNQPGTVKIIPQEPDDLWVVYNLIAKGDIVTTETTRKIMRDDTGRARVSTVKLVLSIRVTRHDFYKDSSSLRISGRIIEGEAQVDAGLFHSFDIGKNKSFELYKKNWDSTHMAALKETSRKPPGADLAVVLIQEETQAEVYLVGNGLTTLCSKIEASQFKKPSAFFQLIFDAFVKHVDFGGSIKSVMIASAESAKDEFRRFMLSEAKRLKMRTIVDNKERIVVARCKGKLKEVLNDEGVMHIIKDSKVVLEIKAARELWESVERDSDRVCYGPRSVEAAQEMLAIEKLLLTDEWYRSSDAKTRHKYEDLAKAVKKSGGQVLVYQPLHVSAQTVAQLSGVAAILRFPLPQLDDDADV